MTNSSSLHVLCLSTGINTLVTLQVVPAEYAFVLHTADPVTSARGQLFGEVVVGMGESLVGNTPGRALSFTAGADGRPHLLSLPGKRTGLFSSAAGNVIARSDSNGEDLEAFAGAGKNLFLNSLICCQDFQK